MGTTLIIAAALVLVAISCGAGVLLCALCKAAEDRTDAYDTSDEKPTEPK